jgi:RimJ/RimL family protein N-acetyltransferase
VQLHTDRLKLRRFRDEDREAFAAMNADARVVEHLVASLDRATSDAFVDRIESRFADQGYGLWAVDVVDDAGPVTGFIGYVGLWDATFDAPFTPAIEVGWRLRVQAWGHGFATEAAIASVDDGFVRCELDEIISFTATVNRRSRAVMERIGLRRQPDGDFDHPAVPLGHPLRPHVLYRFPDLAARRAQARERSGGAGVTSRTMVTAPPPRETGRKPSVS